MRIVHTTTYTVERVTVKEALDKYGDDFEFMDSVRTDPMYVGKYSNRSYLADMPPLTKLYIVLGTRHTTELVDDAPSCSCPGDMWEGDRAEFLAIARKCAVHAEQYKNVRDNRKGDET